MRMSFNFDKILQKHKISENRIIFESYPIFIKHSLFYTDKNIQSNR